MFHWWLKLPVINKGFGNKVSISNHCIIVIRGWHICNCRKWTRAEVKYSKFKSYKSPTRKINANKWNNTVMCFCIIKWSSVPDKNLKLCYSCVTPALSYDCETWILNSTEIRHLNQIQINTLWKILKLSKSTSIPIINSGVGEISIEFRFHERKV